MAKKEKTGQKIQIGISSLVLIFTVLCLVIFATLSLTSAKSDNKLSLKYANGVQGYYKVDGQGEELLRTLNNCILKAKAESKDQISFENKLEKYFQEAGILEGYNMEKGFFHYLIDNENGRLLRIEVLIRDFDKVEKDVLNGDVINWSIENKEDLEIYDDVPVWSGE